MMAEIVVTCIFISIWMVAFILERRHHKHLKTLQRLRQTARDPFVGPITPLLPPPSEGSPGTANPAKLLEILRSELTNRP